MTSKVILGAIAAIAFSGGTLTAGAAAFANDDDDKPKDAKFNAKAHPKTSKWE